MDGTGHEFGHKGIYFPVQPTFIPRALVVERTFYLVLILYNTSLTNVPREQIISTSSSKNLC
jgi:hypothetical protein